MKQFFRWAPILILTGCLAEGALPEDPKPDFGVQVEPDMTLLPEDAGEDLDSGKAFGDICDPFAQDCLGKCVPNPATGEPNCLQRGEERPAGSPCETITQCERGTHCSSVTGDPTNLCRPMCDREGTPVCPSNMVCSGQLASVAEIGLCVDVAPPCDIYTQNCPSSDCVVSEDSQTGDVGTFCKAAGSRAANESCGGAIGECVASHICVRLAGMSLATCQQVCKAGVIDCFGGQTCTGTAASSGIDFCQS